MMALGVFSGFRVTLRLDSTRCKWKQRKRAKAEATLKVVVLDKKTVKVAIRAVRVRDGK